MRDGELHCGQGTRGGYAHKKSCHHTYLLCHGTNISTSVRTYHKTNIRTVYYEHLNLMQICI